MYQQGCGVTADAEQAVWLEQTACRMGHPRACVLLGHSYLKGTGVDKNVTRANELFEQSCEDERKLRHALPDGCTALGDSYETGQGVKKDLKRARELYEFACTERNSSGRDGNACKKLAHLYEQGLGVKKNRRKARQIRRLKSDFKFTTCK